MTFAQNALPRLKPVAVNHSATPNPAAAWTAAMLGILVICGESTRVMGADHTMVWLSRLLVPLVHLANSQMVELNHLLRKCGHFLGYGTLGLIFAQGWLAFLLKRSQRRRASQTWARTRRTAAGLAILCVAAVASLDEIHQSFLPNRTACVSDVVLDTVGAVLMLTFVAVFVTLRRKRAVNHRMKRQLTRHWQDGDRLFRRTLRQTLID